MPQRKYAMARPAPERMAINLRPFLSDNLPQIGPMTALTINEIEKTTPDHILAWSAGTPNSWIRYMGKNGMSMV